MRNRPQHLDNPEYSICDACHGEHADMAKFYPAGTTSEARTHLELCEDCVEDLPEEVFGPILTEGGDCDPGQWAQLQDFCKLQRILAFTEPYQIEDLADVKDFLVVGYFEKSNAT